MGQVVSLDELRLKKALKKGQKKNQPLDMVGLYMEFLLQRLLYQNALAKSKES